MKSGYKNNRKYLFLIVILVIIFLNQLMQINLNSNCFSNKSYSSKEMRNTEQLLISAEESYQKDWIKNPSFTTQEFWNSTIFRYFKV